LGANVTGVTSGSGTGSGTGTGSTKTVDAYLQQAETDYTAAQAALANGDLGLYQKDVNAMNAQLQLALNASSSTSSTTTKNSS